MKDLLTILQGDALEQLRALPDESVQCCVTSPPYFNQRDYGVPGQIGLEDDPWDYIERLVEVFEQVRRVLRNDGICWIVIGDSYAASGRGGGGSFCEERRAWAKEKIQKTGFRMPRPGYKQKDLLLIPAMLAIALRSEGWYLRKKIVWHKKNCMPESATDRPTSSHEDILFLSKKGNYFYDADAIKEPASEADWESRIGRANLNNKLLPTDEINGIRPRVKYTPNNKVNRDRRDLGVSNVAETTGMRNKRDVWTVASANYPEAHFATFPATLISPCILAGSRPGDVVLDPFAGSGTTGMVALELGRKAVLIELNLEYCKLIEQRCNVTPGLAL